MTVKIITPVCVTYENIGVTGQMGLIWGFPRSLINKHLVGSRYVEVPWSASPSWSPSLIPITLRDKPSSVFRWGNQGRKNYVFMGSQQTDARAPGSKHVAIPSHLAESSRPGAVGPKGTAQGGTCPLMLF